MTALTHHRSNVQHSSTAFVVISTAFASRRGCWAAPGTAEAEAELKEVGLDLCVWRSCLFCDACDQLQQLMTAGGQPAASPQAYMARLLRLALLGILCAYAYMWIKKHLT